MELTIKAIKKVKASEMDSMLLACRSNLAELKGYFTIKEKERLTPAVMAAVRYTYRNGVDLANATCRSKEMQRRQAAMIERLNEEFIHSQLWYDYCAETAE